MPDEFPNPQGGGQQIPTTPGVQTGIPGPAGALVNALVNIGNSRKNQATAELNKQLTAAQAGFPIDPKAVEKTAKRAGLPIANLTDLQGMKDHHDNPTGTPPQNSAGTGAKDPLGVPYTGVGPDPHKQAYDVKAITDVKARQQAETNHGIDGMIRQAVTNAHLRGANQQQILEHTQQLLGLKREALDGNPRALGQLAAAGEMSIDVPTNVWQGYNPTQKYKFLEMQRGAESEAQRNARVQASATNLIDSGAFTSPEAAYAAATTLADGKGLTPESKAAMRPTSLVDLTKEVGVAGQLADIGFTGDQIWNMARGANLTGLSNYFPRGMKTTVQQTLAQKNTQLRISQQEANTGSTQASTQRMALTGLDKKDKSGNIVEHIPGEMENRDRQQTTEEREVEVRRISAENTANKMQAALKGQAGKDLIAQYTALVDIKRSGGRVDPDLMNLMQGKLVQAGGGSFTLEEVKDWDNFITGGVHTKLRVTTAPTQDPTAGASMDTPDAGSVDPASAGAGAPQ